MSAEDPHASYEALRTAGHQAAVDLIRNTAPAQPLERVAWMIGYGEVDETYAAVAEARASGHTWREIAEATGLPLRTAISRFERARKRAEGE